VGSTRASGLKDRVFAAVQQEFTEGERVKSVCDGGSDVGRRETGGRGKCEGNIDTVVI